jgi:predicted transposase YbfD/YdcC
MLDIYDLIKDCKLNNLDFTLSLLPDPRVRNHNFTYPLNKLILTMIVAMMSGFTNFRSFEDYAKLHPDICGEATKSTFHRVSYLLDYRLLAMSLNDWLIELLKSIGFDFDNAIVSIDGKCFNGHKLELEGNNLQSFNIYLQEIGVILDSIIFEGKKSHELEVCKESLLNQYSNFNQYCNLITADALYTNQPMLKCILQVKKNYLLTCKQKKLISELLKQSILQESLLKNGKTIKVYKVPQDFVVKTAYNHSYQYDYTNRPKYSKVVKINTKANYESWSDCGIQSLVSITEVIDGIEYNRYYISNMSHNLGCDKYEEITRQRWEVENGLHRNKDMTFREDKQYTRNLNSIGILSALRNFVISILHINGYRATTKTVRSLCNMEEKCLALLGHKKLSRV